MGGTEIPTNEGKIKDAPPLEGQAIEMAWPFAGASVGSRAARKRKISFFKPVSGTSHPDLYGGLA
jgi:hypothetical protein